MIFSLLVSVNISINSTCVLASLQVYNQGCRHEINAYERAMQWEKKMPNIKARLEGWNWDAGCVRQGASIRIIEKTLGVGLIRLE